MAKTGGNRGVFIEVGPPADSSFQIAPFRFLSHDLYEE